MKYTRLALWLLVCAVLGLSVAVYCLRIERTRDLRDVEGLAVRAGVLEKENAALKDRLYHAEARLGMIERGVLIPGKAYETARRMQAEEARQQR